MNRDIIQSLWIGDRLSPLEQLSIRSFLANGHPFHLYTYGAVADVPAGAIVKDANSIIHQRHIFRHRYKHKGSLAGFADWFRWELLYRQGGWWVDMDIVCLQPFDFPQKLFFTQTDIPSRPRNGNCILKFPAGHRMLRLLTRICTRPCSWMPWDNMMGRLRKTYRWLKGRRHPYHSDFGVGGYAGLAQAIRHWGLASEAVPVELFSPVPYQAVLLLFQAGGGTLVEQIFRDCYAVHFFNEALRTIEQPAILKKSGIFAGKDARYPSDSPFEILKRHYGVR